MVDLARWLGECLDAEEAEARLTADAFGAVWTTDDAMESVGSDTGADVVTEPYAPRSFIAEHDPARVLREIDAKRQLLARYERAMENRRAHPDDLASAGALLALHGAVKLIALPYADKPGYREEWAP